MRSRGHPTCKSGLRCRLPCRYIFRRCATAQARAGQPAAQPFAAGRDMGKVAICHHVTCMRLRHTVHHFRRLHSRQARVLPGGVKQLIHRPACRGAGAQRYRTITGRGGCGRARTSAKGQDAHDHQKSHLAPRVLPAFAYHSLAARSWQVSGPACFGAQSWRAGQSS